MNIDFPYIIDQMDIKIPKDRMLDMKFVDSLSTKNNLLIIPIANITSPTKSQRCSDNVEDFKDIIDSYEDKIQYYNIEFSILMINTSTSEIVYYFNSKNSNDETALLFKRRADRKHTWKKIMELAFADFLTVYNQHN